jgi:hypothetical protein
MVAMGVGLGVEERLVKVFPTTHITSDDSKGYETSTTAHTPFYFAYALHLEELMNEQQTHNNQRLNDLLDLLDELHSAASDANVTEFSGMSQQELMSFLREVVYTSQETIREIQQHRKKATTFLRVAHKIEKVS